MDNVPQAAGAPENPTIPLHLPLQFVNLALVGLAKLPGEVCIPVIEDIKRQAYAHIATLRAQAETEHVVAAAPPPPPSPAGTNVRATASARRRSGKKG